MNGMAILFLSILRSTRQRILCVLRCHSVSRPLSSLMVCSNFAKYRLPSDAVTVDSLEELHGRYGDVLLPLAAQNPTAYRLNKVLRERTPPLVCLRRIAETMVAEVH